MSSGIHVNFSDREAASEARDFTPLPTGNYYCKITDGSLEECGPESKNPGKPYWNLELTVQDGPYEDRRLFDNVMLFDGALYSFSQLMKALDYDINEGGFEVPELPELIGNDVYIGARKVKNKYLMEREGTDEPIFSTDVKNYRKWTGQSSSANAPTQSASTSGNKEQSILP